MAQRSNVDDDRRTPGGPAEGGAARKEPKYRVSFALHEFAEYIVAIALVAVGFHTSGSAQILLVAIGAAMLVVGAVTAGKLGAVALLNRRAHHAADIVLIGVLALSPIVLFSRLHIPGTVLAEVIAAVLLRIERGTAYQDAPKVRRAEVSRDSRLPGNDPAARIGATAGAVASSAMTTATRLTPVAGRAARTGLRTLGVVAGVTRRTAREQSAQRRNSGS